MSIVATSATAETETFFDRRSTAVAAALSSIGLGGPALVHVTLLLMILPCYHIGSLGIKIWLDWVFMTRVKIGF